MENVKNAVKIFKLLMLNGQFNRKDNLELYNSYLEAEVQEVLNVFEEEFECKVLNFDDVLYLVPKVESDVLGIKPPELRYYFGSNATLKDVYLGYYIMMYIFYEFFSGENKDPKKIDFIHINHLIDNLDERFSRFSKLNDEDIVNVEEEYLINIRSAVKTWIAMIVDHESKRKTKYNIVKNVCKILEDQGLAYLVEDQIRTTKKLDTLMRQYYLSLDRLSSIHRAFEEGVL